MRRLRFFCFIILCLQIVTAKGQNQTYSILIKGGHVVDAKNKISEVMDVAIKDGKIAKVAKNIDRSSASRVIDASGLYVSPGLIDVHAHIFWGTDPDSYLSNGTTAVSPDGFSFRTGVTTMVDCGGAGWRSFDTFKKNIIDNSKTRIFSFLNIVGQGMRGGAWEQDVADMDSKKAAETALANKDYIIGFKLAHYRKSEWTPVERIIAAANQAKLPVIIDFGGALSLDTLFHKYLRPGDMYTHTYRDLVGRDQIVDPKTKTLKPFVLEARKKGILFDVGFGGGSFNFNQAIPAIKAGFLPDLMGTDLHAGSMNGSMKDQMNVLSIFMSMGMDVASVIARSTWEPAKAINHEELGNLSEGAIADVAILGVRIGKFGFKDVASNVHQGTQRLECELTIKDGRVVYDLNAR